MENIFREWLDEKLAAKHWDRAELARRALVSETMLSLMYNGKRKGGIKTIRAIADALGVDVKEVLRALGLEPDLPTPRDAFEELIHKRLSMLDDSQLDEVVKFIDYLMTRDQKPIRVVDKLKIEKK